MTYKEQLRDPRWIAKKNVILERDNHVCRACNEDAPPFHVHHLYYEKGKMAWECDNSYLITLCDLCHELIHHEIKKAESELLFNSSSLIRINIVNRLLIAITPLTNKEISRLEENVKDTTFRKIYS